MSKTTLRAGTTSPFAHLLSAFRPNGRRAEDDKQPDDNQTGAEDGDGDSDDEEARKARRAEEDERRQEEDARRAEEDEKRQEEDARRAEEDGDDQDPENKDSKSKRGKRADDGDDDHKDDEETEAKAEDMDDDEKCARARSEGFGAAQARGRLIFSSPAAAKRPDVAAHLAFNETMPSAKAVAMLEMAANGEAPSASGSRLGRRMARVVIPNPGTGGDTARSTEPSFAQMAAAAAEKAGIAK